MSIENWTLFVAVCLVASMTPGPGILSVITHSVYHGTKNSIPIILGILSGLFLLSIMAVMGLGVLLESSKPSLSGYSILVLLIFVLLELKCLNRKHLFQQNYVQRNKRKVR